MDIVYTYTPEDGELGEPSRKIDFGGLDHSLLQEAYFIDRDYMGDDYEDIPERNLVVILKAAKSPLHSTDIQAIHQHYRHRKLEFFGETGYDPGEEMPTWCLDFDVVGLSDEAVDAVIRNIVRSHNEELDWVKAFLPGGTWQGTVADEGADPNK